MGRALQLTATTGVYGWILTIAIAIAIAIVIVIGTLGVALGVALDPARMHPTRAIASALDRATLRLRLVIHHASSRRCR